MISRDEIRSSPREIGEKHADARDVKEARATVEKSKKSRWKGARSQDGEISPI